MARPLRGATADRALVRDDREDGAASEELQNNRIDTYIIIDQVIDYKREIVGLHIGPSEAEPFCSTFLRDLVRRGPKGVKLVIPDAHEGLNAAITCVVGATWQRCRVHFMRNALAHMPKGQNIVVAAAIHQFFFQPDHAAATQSWRHVADQLRARWPKLGQRGDGNFLIFDEDLTERAEDISHA